MDEDAVRSVVLGGKTRPAPEPPLGKLRRIVRLYRALGQVTGNDDTAADRRLTLVNRLLAAFFPGQKLGAITGNELTAFLEAIPDLCGLERAKPGAIDNTGDQAFGNIYAHLAAAFGWHYDYIDKQVTMSQLKDMSDYMKRNPPTHQLVAAYLGYEYQTPEDKLRRFFMAAKGRG